MSVPKYDEFFSSIIKCLGDGNVHTLKELVDFCADEFDLNNSDRSETLASGQNMLSNRVGWAKFYLKKAGLIDSPKRAHFCLTEAGKDALKNGPQNVTLNYLYQLDSFRKFINGSYDSQQGESKVISEQSPQEQIETALNEINGNLTDELMSEVMKLSPYEFESLVVRLLIEMGYGTLEDNKNAVTKKSCDEGIDGIITADKFGLDYIYVQAKQWNNDSSVGRPEIQKFLGAMVSKGATKGVFITTAHFSNDAIKFAANTTQCRIVLVNGNQLAKLMIEYDLGVSTAAVYKVKVIDSDFFSDGI